MLQKQMYMNDYRNKYIPFDIFETLKLRLLVEFYSWWQPSKPSWIFLIAQWHQLGNSNSNSLAFALLISVKTCFGFFLQSWPVPLVEINICLLTLFIYLFGCLPKWLFTNLVRSYIILLMGPYMGPQLLYMLQLCEQ